MSRSGAEADEVMERVTAAIDLGRTGDRDEARARLAAIWDELGPSGDPLHRCTVAHFAADLQEDPRVELEWDERALEAAMSLTDERAQRYHASLQVEGFMPSLHLNLAEDHRTLGDLGRARQHADLAAAFADPLPDDGYGRMIRQGIARIASELRRGSI